MLLESWGHAFLQWQPILFCKVKKTFIDVVEVLWNILLLTLVLYILMFILIGNFRSIENAATLYKELGDVDNAAKNMEIAVDRYAESGTLDTSAMALDKAGRLFESSDPEKAIEVQIFYFFGVVFALLY